MIVFLKHGRWRSFELKMVERAKFLKSLVEGSHDNIILFEIT